MRVPVRPQKRTVDTSRNADIVLAKVQTFAVARPFGGVHPRNRARAFSTVVA